jgi:hypothetical protein
MANLSEKKLEEILKKPGYELEPVKMRERVSRERGKRSRKKPLVDGKGRDDLMGRWTYDYAIGVLETSVDNRTIIGWKFIDGYISGVPVHFAVYGDDGSVEFIVIDNEVVSNRPIGNMGVSADFWDGRMVSVRRVRYRDHPTFMNFDTEIMETSINGPLYVGEFSGARSATEMMFHNWCESMLMSGGIDAFVYEPVSLRMPGITYTPDFFVWAAHGMIAYEVKNKRDAYNSADRSSLAMRAVAGWLPGEFPVKFATLKDGEWVFTSPRMLRKMPRHPQLARIK